MADVVVRSTQPALAAIKLAWWRERLEELDQGKVPAEPRLQAAAKELVPRGITGAELAGLEDGWAALLEELPGSQRVARTRRLPVRARGAAPDLDFDDELRAAGAALCPRRRRSHVAFRHWVLKPWSPAACSVGDALDR